MRGRQGQFVLGPAVDPDDGLPYGVSARGGPVTQLQWRGRFASRLLGIQLTALSV